MKKEIQHLSREEIISVLLKAHSSNKKIKKRYRSIKKEKMELENKMNKIKNLLNYTTYHFDKYDFPSEREDYRLQGKVELKEELMSIIAEI